jgi:hypothetical protein
MNQNEKIKSEINPTIQLLEVGFVFENDSYVHKLDGTELFEKAEVVLMYLSNSRTWEVRYPVYLCEWRELVLTFDTFKNAASTAMEKVSFFYHGLPKQFSEKESFLLQTLLDAGFKKYQDELGVYFQCTFKAVDSPIVVLQVSQHKENAWKVSYVDGSRSIVRYFPYQEALVYCLDETKRMVKFGRPEFADID